LSLAMYPLLYLSAVYIVGLPIANIILMLLHNTNNSVVIVKIKYLLVMAFVYGIGMLFLGYTVSYNAILMLVYSIPLAFHFLFLFYLEFIRPLFKYSDKKSWNDRYISDAKMEASFDYEDIQVRAFRNVGYGWHILLLVALLGAPVTYFIGAVDASKRTEYMVLKDKTNHVVIRKYDDTLIAMPFDRKSKTIEPTIIVRKIESDGISFVVDSGVGPLKLNVQVK